MYFQVIYSCSLDWMHFEHICGLDILYCLILDLFDLHMFLVVHDFFTWCNYIFLDMGTFKNLLLYKMKRRVSFFFLLVSFEMANKTA